MKDFLLSEIRKAAIWTKDSVISMALWLFRLSLRFGMLGALLFLIGSGCYGIYSVYYPRAQSQDDSLVIGVSHSSSHAELTQISSPATNDEAIQSPMETSRQVRREVKSGWDMLNSVARDFQRFRRNS